MTRVRIDFQRVADAALRSLESLCAAWLPSGHRDGHEWKALNPKRADSRIGSFSINLNTGAWADFATGDKGGDAISLYAFLHDRSQLEAARVLAAELGLDTNPVGGSSGRTGGGAVASDAAPRRRSEWDAVIPVPALAGELPKAHIKRGKPEARWDYRAADGALLGAVYRFRTSDGGKEVLPCVWARHRDSGAQEWRWLAFPDPRPLYGLDRLKPVGTVLVVEGEKCVDAARAVLPPEISVTTWPGGGKAVAKANWAPLAGRDVIVWPDCDAQKNKAGAILPEEEQPGIVAAERVAEILRALDCTVRIVAIPAPGAKPPGWDVADAIAEGWTADQVRAFVRDNLRPPGASRASAEKIAKSNSDEDDELVRNSRGDIAACEHNAYVLLRRDARYGELHFDEFLRRPRFGDRDWLDRDDLAVLRLLQGEKRIAKFTQTQVRAAVRSLAFERVRDCLKDFVHTLPAWDGVPRIEEAFIVGWGAPDTPVVRAAARNFFIALIARALVPGAKVDSLWAFEGKQGIGKSRALRELAGPFHVEITAQIGTTDFMREMLAAWIAEFSELDALRKGEASTIKKLLSAQEDRFVQKFQLYAESYPRRAISVATTNETKYWQDPTGARRLVPVVCTAIDIDAIRALRLMWFSEAREAFNTGAAWWEWPAAIVDEQEARQQEDPWEGLLRDYIKNGRKGGINGDAQIDFPEGWISTHALLYDWLRVPPERQSRVFSTRIGQVMRRLGYQAARGEDGARGAARGWKPITAGDTSTPSASEVSAQVSGSFSEEVPF